MTEIQRTPLDLKGVLDFISDAEHEKWIHELCDPRFSPRGPSEGHHTGDGIHKRRDVILRVPLHHGHHRLVTDEPYFEKLLELRKKSIYFLNLHLFEKTKGQFYVDASQILAPEAF